MTIGNTASNTIGKFPHAGTLARHGQPSLNAKTRPAAGTASCATCRVRRQCLPKSLDGASIELFDRLVRRPLPQPKGKVLYRQGEPFESVFAIRSGSAKTTTIDPNGGSHVMDFHLPGDILGLTGIAAARHAGTATALEHLAVCELPIRKLHAASRELPGLQARLLEIAAMQMTRKQQLQTVTNHCSATLSVMSFLIDLSARLERISLSPRSFRLPMTRIDLASHLGLTVETVSRVFTQLAQRRLITVNNRDITLLALDDLRRSLGRGTSRQARPGAAQRTARPIK